MNIKNIIPKYDIISFDVFDTLLFRRVECPENVFEITADRELNTNADKECYVKSRILAEQRLKKQGEAHFDEIYGEIKKFFPNEYQRLRDTEIKVEKDVIYPNKEMVDLLDWSKKSGKKIIIVSDMYYTASVLNNYLSLNGIKIKQQIYVSCDYNATKSSGELWNIVKEHNYDKTILHIGNAIKGDFFRPISRGIDAVLYRREEKAIYVGKSGIKFI